jgi:hypothetical protein
MPLMRVLAHDFRPSALDIAAMDQRDREKFYSDPEKTSDDDEYELEPLDTVAEENRRKAARESVDPTIDIDEIYRESDRSRGDEIIENWVANFQYRYRHEHVLIATAVLAIAAALATLQLLWTAVILLVMASVFGLYSYLQWEESKQQAEAERKREIVYARRRAKLAARASGHAVGTPEIPSDAVPVVPEESADDEQLPADARLKPAFQFQFSLRELIVTFTVAAVLLGAIQFAGGAAFAATVFGTIALLGLILFATSFELPQIVLLGWWLTLLLYVATTIIAAMWEHRA